MHVDEEKLRECIERNLKAYKPSFGGIDETTTVEAVLDILEEYVRKYGYFCRKCNGRIYYHQYTIDQLCDQCKGEV